ncbi:PREDICTED: uncharacterized protein LOC104749294 [Camelina sativa]|uniref:Uncharacterized protein LOC104749294 n=1 Tax=Camelina sativa TaxID=90675 RepID=A0ABM0WCQ0_CAMSA|nr:PREDICTED: uncharacterized protein LOC104749294 [Camelina sativa]XP_010469189.1 PREDICTED: uncharacterized protein LOC104749294 [Camelina sativa]
MFRQSMAFPPPIHGSDAAPPPQPPPVVTVSETSRRHQQQISAAAASSSPVKSHPLHNFPLSDLRWAMNHANTHRLRKASSRSPLREPNPGKGSLVTEDVNEASGSSSFELRPDKKKKSDSAADRSGTKSTTPDGRSKIFIRIRTKNNEDTADIATTAVSTDNNNPPAVHAADDSAGPAIDADAERISDGCGQEADEFGPKTWNLRPRKPPPTKKRSIGHAGGILKSCNGSLPENKTLGTVRTESIRSRNGVDAKMAATTTTERKEKKPRLSISLSKLEIDEDIYALTGSKPSRRPKKRAKNVQKQLDVLFPGLWMGNVSSDAYKVSEHA